MDSLTHIALGACLGELQAGKTLGKKALLIGAAAQSLPDIDFIASFWLSPAASLLAHRGFTHSIFFVILTSAGLALAASRWRSLGALRFGSWWMLFGLQTGVHILLDAFNAYGTAWFEPFSHYRVSFNTLFVADPFFTLPLATAAVVLLIGKTSSKNRAWWSRAAIFMCLMYLTYSVVNKVFVTNRFHQKLTEKDFKLKQLLVTPTPGNVWLWYLVAEVDEGYFIAHYSVFDEAKELPLTYFPRQETLLDNNDDPVSVQLLIRFSEGYYIVSLYDGKLVFNDLRFGQMLGWEDPTAPFVFYYFLQQPADNDLLIQRGRFAGWDAQAFLRFVERIRGVRAIKNTAPGNIGYEVEPPLANHQNR